MVNGLGSDGINYQVYMGGQLRVEASNVDIFEITGGSGNDQITDPSGTNTLSGDFKTTEALTDAGDTITGGTGPDAIYAIGPATTTTFDLSQNNLHGSDGDDQITASGGPDVVSGGAGNDSLSGWEGNDSINGNDGDDTLYGLNGDDTLDGGANTDACLGGNGTDTAIGCESTSDIP